MTLSSNAPNGTQGRVADLFEGRSVFITGASGFLGRVLLEKLLRCYPGIVRVYVLLRSKRNQQPYERLHKQLLKVPIFDRLREQELKFAENGTKGGPLSKIVVVPGDISEPRLGISDADWDQMMRDSTLSIVFHSAATIKFDEPLRVSVQLNLIATKTIVEMCKRLPNLACLCHVSTAYVNSDLKDQRPIEERLYPMEHKPEQLISMAQSMDENLMQLLKGHLIGQRPNTYTYTKALAEHLIASEAADLPVAIVRPSIVVAAWREPLPGWIDNLNGPTGMILAVGKGLMRSMHVQRDNKADVIPVDVTINTMIAAVYVTAKEHNKLAPRPSPTANTLVHACDESANSHAAQTNDSSPTNKEANGLEHVEHSSLAASEGKPTNHNTPTSNGFKQQQQQQQQPSDNNKSHHLIVHCNSGEIRPITWGAMEDTFFPILRRYPSRQVLRYPFGSFKSNKTHDFFARLLAHYLPALIIDLLCIMMGKKAQLMSIYRKLHGATAALAHFTTHNYNFRTHNLKILRSKLPAKDQEELFMDLERLKWVEFWDAYVLGARRYVLKEDDETLDEARRSFRRAFYIEIGLRALLITLVAWLLMPLLRPSLVSATHLTQQALTSLSMCT